MKILLLFISFVVLTPALAGPRGVRPHCEQSVTGFDLKRSGVDVRVAGAQGGYDEEARISITAEFLCRTKYYFPARMMNVEVKIYNHEGKQKVWTAREATFSLKQKKILLTEKSADPVLISW